MQMSFPQRRTPCQSHKAGDMELFISGIHILNISTKACSNFGDEKSI